MPRQDFEQHLEALQSEMLEMGSMVATAISRSTAALVNRDLSLAEQVIAEDLLINRKRYDIEEMAIELIAMQQPLARDLRVIIAVLNVIVDLERIGDHAEGNAKIAIMIGDEPPLKPYIDVPLMAEKTNEMLFRAMDAFNRRDADAAGAIIGEDDVVDGLYDRVFRELLTFMAADPKTIGRATRLIWVAHNLERSADRVTNICERIIFVITGKVEETGASK